MTAKTFIYTFIIMITLLLSSTVLLLDISNDYIVKQAKRIPDIRKINKEYRLNYINDYLSHKTNKTDSYIIVLGDSQFYGYHQNEDDIFTNYLMDYTPSKILNLAFNDARPSDVIRQLEIIQSHNIKIDAIIYGLNIGHFGDSNGTNVRRLPEQTSDSLFALYTLKVNIDFWKEELSKQLFNTKFSQVFTGAIAQSAPTAPPKQIDLRYPLLLKKISELSKTAIIIFQPRSEIDTLRQAEHSKVKEQWVQRYKHETMKEDLNFLDASDCMDNSCFIDNTHINAKGHKVFSKKLLNELTLIWPHLFK